MNREATKVEFPLAIVMSLVKQAYISSEVQGVANSLSIDDSEIISFLDGVASDSEIKGAIDAWILVQEKLFGRMVELTPLES